MHIATCRNVCKFAHVFVFASRLVCAAPLGMCMRALVHVCVGAGGGGGATQLEVGAFSHKRGRDRRMRKTPRIFSERCGLGHSIIKSSQ